MCIFGIVEIFWRGRSRRLARVELVGGGERLDIAARGEFAAGELAEEERGNGCYEHAESDEECHAGLAVSCRRGVKKGGGFGP